MQEMLRLSIDVKTICPEIEMKLLLVITKVIEKGGSIEKLAVIHATDKRIK